MIYRRDYPQNFLRQLWNLKATLGSIGSTQTSNPNYVNLALNSDPNYVP